MRQYQPAIYICTDCNVEVYGDRHSLPLGWDRCTTPHGRDAVRCGSCLEQIEQRHFDARAPHPFARPTTGMVLGILAARFSGVLVRASDLPRAEPRP
ncbi:MAG: hypothetical protein CVT74_05020 [Alphaproteobacteria bacterium HGW-Alphaproteobacteria-13]|nr:MAG: hypothetical protein CVT74_05020 [Alphaproteobacteria bacterium HGW-Alphaproteobacteria-13]